MDTDAYNVSKYTDVELFELMDLSNPTDRELEARIIQLIRKYNTMHNESGRAIMKFFEDVYDHFFDDGEEEDDDIEGYEDPEQTPANNGANNTTTSGPTAVANTGTTAGTANNTGTTTGAGATGTTAEQKDNILVNQLDYTKDKLNPLLKQTVKRVVSIDSQYRDVKYPLSTEFTFNLSEPLRDVVSLRLYSIQIPVTWYTISNNFGGNFFILKGNAPGLIDNPNFEYKVEIASGNYTADNLAKAVNDGIQNLKQTYMDLSFGDTNISYNPINTLATMKVDIRNVFTENSYQLEFADWSSPIQTDSSGVELRYKGNTTLPAYLGFNSQTYLLNQIVSDANLPLIENSLAEDTNNAIYSLDGSNNYFDIIQYKGPSDYTIDTVALNTIRIQLDLSGVYSRNAIVSEINTKLQNSIYLNNSGITRVNNTDSTLDNFGHSYYKMTINLNKSNTLSDYDSLKSVIVFPNEPNLNVRVWTKVGAAETALCALLFKELYNELSDVFAETETLQTNYVVKSKPYIVYKCIRDGYVNPYSVGNYSTVTDLCFNDYKIMLPESPDFGWSFSEYLQVINTEYASTNSKTISNSNPTGVFNMTNMGIFNNTELSKIFFRNDINRLFLKDNYMLDLNRSAATSYFFTELGLGAPSPNNIDLSLNNVFTSIIDAPPSYRVSNAYQYLCVIYPKPGYSTNSEAAPWYIPPVPELRTGRNLQQFISYVNTSFQNFQDGSGSNPLSETNLTAVLNIDNTVSFTLTVQVNKALTENDYQIQFYDLSASSGTIVSANNYWNFTNNTGLVSSPVEGVITLTGTTDASYVNFTRTGYGFSATNRYTSPGMNAGFNASNYIIPSSDDWTVSLWYYSILPTTDLSQVLFCQYSPVVGGLQFMISNNTVELTISGDIVVNAPFASAIQNSWHMFTVVRESNTYSIYYDGGLVVSSTTSTAYTIPNVVSSPFTLGIHGYARGYWDDVALWTYAVQPEQIADMYSPYLWQNSVNNSWYNNLKVGDPSYNLIDYKIEGTSYADIYGISVISGYTYTIVEDTSFALIGMVPGITDASSTVIITIPAAPAPNYQYTRQQLFNIINSGFAANPLSMGSYVGIERYNDKDYVKFRLNLNQIYTAKDYRVVFYDPFSFVKCYAGIKSVRNASWDSTLGWILGFRETTEYVLSDYGAANPISIVGDTAVTTNLYNYFLIVLDDYTQSHLNDGLVTVTQQENDIALPSYANRTKITCDSNGDPVFNDPNLTQNQIYAANQIIQAKQNRKRYASTPAVQDVFALIPMKTGGLANGSSYIEFGGTLQNQERTYFGPVNIQRMTIKLLNDRGDVVDLNGSNWSFSLICEQLYQQKSL